MVTSISAILLGIVNIAIVVVILLLAGAILLWIFELILKLTIPQMIQQLYLALVALVALYMVIALLFGLPSITLFRP